MLLTAALAEPAAAAAAWRRLPEGFTLDDLERGAFPTLPLVYRNLSEEAPSEPLVAKLKGVYRKSWVVNSLVRQRLRAAEEALRGGGIETLYVEGIALAERFYAEAALRPAATVDVLVQPGELRSALARLARAGWRPRQPTSAEGPEPRYLYDDAGRMCVLRTTLGPDVPPARRGERELGELWESALRETVADADVLVPSPTDTLLAVCISNARATPVPSVQWILDAKMLLRAEIDWERLVSTASGWSQVTRLREALHLLTGLPGATPPESVLAALDAVHASRRERLAYVCTAGAVRGAGSLPIYLAEHLARTREEPALRVAATFPGHLRDRWGLSSRAQLPASAARRALRRVGKRVRGAV